MTAGKYQEKVESNMIEKNVSRDEEMPNPSHVTWRNQNTADLSHTIKIMYTNATLDNEFTHKIPTLFLATTKIKIEWLKRLY